MHLAKLFSLLLLLWIFTSGPAFAIPPAEVAIQCKRALSDSPIAEWAKPLYRSLAQVRQENPGINVRDFLKLRYLERDGFLEKIRELSLHLEPGLRSGLLRLLPILTWPHENLIALREAELSYGDEKIPDRTQLRDNQIYDLWEPRLLLLGRTSLQQHEFNVLGKMIVGSLLPRTTALNVRPYEASTTAERARLFYGLNATLKAWIREDSQNNLQIDVVFNDGKAFGMIYCLKKPLESPQANDLKIKLELQLTKLNQLRAIYARQGIQKDGYVIFLGHGPTADLLDYLSSVHINAVVIPYDFGA